MIRRDPMARRRADVRAITPKPSNGFGLWHVDAPEMDGAASCRSYADARHIADALDRGDPRALAMLAQRNAGALASAFIHEVTGETI